MKINKVGIEIIKKYEGFRSKPYICPSGIPSIGYGTTRYPSGKKVTMKDAAINESTANLYLLNDVSRFAVAVTKGLKVTLNENRFSALVSLCYNIGPGAFGRSTLLKVVNEAPGAPGIRDEFAKWNKGTVNGKKTVLPGLVTRRAAEADLYFKQI